MIPKTIQQKLDEGRQYRSVVEIRAVDEEMIVEGYATTFNTPYTLYEDNDFRIDEQVDARAFDNADMSDVIMQYDHEGRVFARISNGTLQLEPDEHGLHVRADLSGTEIGRQLYEEIKGGYTSKMSFGFTVESDEELRKEEDGKETYLRTITGIRKLYDVSAVSLPANNATEISARAYCEGVIAEAAEERRAAAERERQKRKIKILMEV
ncbi:MAG: HK97 family phage prohead protease [Oscillospiraceae bacterium]|nr:HK97 family phage prohead protease [Oscillospiraceae bacterium]